MEKSIRDLVLEDMEGTEDDIVMAFDKAANTDEVVIQPEEEEQAFENADADLDPTVTIKMSDAGIMPDEKDADIEAFNAMEEFYNPFGDDEEIEIAESLGD